MLLARGQASLLSYALSSVSFCLPSLPGKCAFAVCVCTCTHMHTHPAFSWGREGTRDQLQLPPTLSLSPLTWKPTPGMFRQAQRQTRAFSRSHSRPRAKLAVKPILYLLLLQLHGTTGGVLGPQTAAPARNFHPFSPSSASLTWGIPSSDTKEALWGSDRISWKGNQV